MIMKRILSFLLAAMMVLGAMMITVGAEEAVEDGTLDEGAAEQAGPIYTENTSNTKATIDYLNGKFIDENGKPTGELVETPEDKLSTMDLRLEKDGFRLYVDAYSGEVATYCIATGEILFSNPYSVGKQKKKGEGVTPSESIKRQLMSQLVVKYTDIATGNENTFYSYTEAAERGQIVIKNIKNGLRVEYTIGREQARMLVPRQIEKTSFETKILEVMAACFEDGVNNFYYKKMLAYYPLKDTSTVSSETAKKEMETAFPITKKMAVYVLDSTTSTVEMAKIEGYIKTYCPNYTYEDLDEDHLLTEYESEDENPPLFKMALEYTLDEYGMSVRLPANGIRFNESLYRLDYIEILPYMGAGENPNAGYTFFPDGSGAIFDFQKIAALGSANTITGKVYGQDYAYHTITGTHQEIIRYPVFGVAEEHVVSETFPLIDEATGEQKKDYDGDGNEILLYETKTHTVDRGYLAIVEEGDALMELSAYHAVRTSDYNTVRMIVYPRPQDTYNIADAISVGTNDTWTVVSERKYTGNYKVRYIMLTDSDLGDAAKEAGTMDDYYTTDYVGMANAYRDYLERNEILTRLTEEDVKEDIPLFIETFGAVKTTKKILSIPVEAMAPLTTFADISAMYDELSKEGNDIENVNFILSGYTKGGMNEPQVPYHLKWESVVGGKSGFEDLVNDAKEKDFGIFPDFDFVFISGNKLFDGVNLKNHAVKTIDNRYTSKRVYSATKQTYISYFELALSPAYFSHFYEKLTDNYLKYGATGISVSTLGSYLNSDFDEDDPYNRADAKDFTVEAFAYLDSKYDKVMTSGGNAFSWKYVDYITDIALDSSRYSQAGASVPFLGMVLHGYVEFAGSPLNMEGNIDYAFLKAIENGASLYFILSYQNDNTALLKNDEVLSQYYSVRYDIWMKDLVEIYQELNGLLGDLQTSIITDHKFIAGERVPDDVELKADAQAALKEAIAREEAKRKEAAEKKAAELLAARTRIAEILQDLASRAQSLTVKVENMQLMINQVLQDTVDPDTTAVVEKCALNAFKEAETAYLAAKQALADAQAVVEAAGEAATPEQKAAVTAAEAEVKKTEGAYNNNKSALHTKMNAVYLCANDLYTQEYNAKALLDEAKACLKLLEDNNALPQASIDALKVTLQSVQTEYDKFVTPKDDAVANAIATYNTVKATVADMEATEIVEYVPTLAASAPTVSDDEMEGDEEGSDETDDENAGENKDEEAEAPEADAEEEEATVPSKYESDSNKIALVTYENGTTFILNFNNYKVITEVDGVKYTVDAYGYIVLKN